MFDLFFIINEKLKFFLLEKNIKKKNIIFTKKCFKKMFPKVSTKCFNFNFKDDKIQGEKMYYILNSLKTV